MKKKILTLASSALLALIVSQAHAQDNGFADVWGETLNQQTNNSASDNADPVLAQTEGSPDVRRNISLGNIQVSAPSQTSAQIILNLPSGENQATIRNTRQEYSVFIANLGVSESDASRSVDVSGTNPVVSSYSIIPGNGGARINFELKTPVNQNAYDQDGTLFIDLEAKNPDFADANAQEDNADSQDDSAQVPNFQNNQLPLASQNTGDPNRINLSLQDVPVRQLLQIFANQRGINMVISDDVQGNISLELDDVPWEQALDIVLRSENLGKRQEGEILFIAPQARIQADEQAILQAQRNQDNLAPLDYKVIQLDFADAMAIADVLSEDRSGGDGVDNSLISGRGQVIADERTNSLMIRDLPENIAKISELVVSLDRPVRQVMIDARIVLASDDFSKSIGTRWGVAAFRDTDNNTQAAIAGGQGATGYATSGTATLFDRIGVDLRSKGALDTNPATMGFALLSKNFLLDLELSAMQAEGRGETLSNPRVVTANNQEAVIKQGEEIPYVTVSDNGTQTEFKEAVLELRVTPRITPSNQVFLDLVVRKDARGAETNGNLAINTREVETKVLVDDGNTVVLGGIFEQVSAQTLEKVPFLGDIPGVGKLFRRNSNTNNKFELLVFVTPTIM